MSYEYDPQRIVYFGATDSRNRRIPFGIRAIDRSRHMYVIGKTGMGKSTLLENLAIQDIQNGEGICFIDPHGGTAETLLEFVPEHRIDDVIYFAPFDTEYPVGFNVMEDVGYDKRHLVVAGLMSSFQRIWVDAWSARMEYILQNTLLALLEYPDTTLIDVNRMLINKEFRDKVVEYVSDPIVKRFWVEEFAGYTDRYTQEATPAIQNKIGQFSSNPLVRNIIAQPKSSFDIREAMDTNKILIVNLSKGRMGEQNADLLGSMIVTKIYLSAMSRAEETPQTLAKLPPFYLYVDEFQSVVNDSFANILSEARKYKLSLTIAHQYIEQVEEHIRAAVFGNAGTIITFRVGPFDAETLKTVFEPTFYAEDLVNLGKFQIYLTLMIDGEGSKPFSATTLPAVEDPPKSYAQQAIARSREQFTRSRAKVEEQIRGIDSAVGPGGFENLNTKRNRENREREKRKKQAARNNATKEEHTKHNTPPTARREKREKKDTHGKAGAHSDTIGAHSEEEKKALRAALASIATTATTTTTAPKKERTAHEPRTSPPSPPQPRHHATTKDARASHSPLRAHTSAPAPEKTRTPREVPREVLNTLLRVDE